MLIVPRSISAMTPWVCPVLMVVVPLFDAEAIPAWIAPSTVVMSNAPPKRCQK